MKDSFSISDCTEAELWQHVAVHLEERGIGVVLVGGAVVAVYSEGAYRSGDLDFVQEKLFEDDIGKAMEEIGFQRRGRHYEHPECTHLLVEFVSPPLGIGDDLNITPRRVKVGTQTLKILSPTDCVRDRLASYIHFQARECLDQAALVARAQVINFEAIERCCLSEGNKGKEAFEDLKRVTRGK